MGGVALRHGAVGLDASLAQLVDRGLGEIRVLLVAAVYGGLVGVTHVSGKGEHELLPAPRDVGDANHPHRTPPQDRPGSQHLARTVRRFGAVVREEEAMDRVLPGDQHRAGSVVDEGG